MNYSQLMNALVKDLEKAKQAHEEALNALPDAPQPTPRYNEEDVVDFGFKSYGVDPDTGKEALRKYVILKDGSIHDA